MLWITFAVACGPIALSHPDRTINILPGWSFCTVCTVKLSHILLVLLLLLFPAPLSVSRHVRLLIGDKSLVIPD